MGREIVTNGEEVSYDLLESSWIPVLRESGASERIAPWQVTSRLSGANRDPVLEIASPRDDFDGALLQFLIGLFQMAFDPADEGEWERWWDGPPTGEEIRERLGPFADAFRLLGEGPRFEQDLSFAGESPKRESVEKLLLDHSITGTQAIFAKEGRVQGLCLPCAATALWTLQLNAPSGGRGHRTGLRGGGPLTTVVVERETTSLWRTVWMNVLPRFLLTQYGDPDREELADKLPWMAPTRTSEGGRATQTTDIHPLQVFWGMPRRIRLDTPSEAGSCSLCGEDGLLVASYVTRPLGVSYEGSWKHPLSPARIDKKTQQAIPLKGPKSGISFRDYLGLVVSGADQEREPAAVVTALDLDSRWPFRRDRRLWAFGYAMNNMKAECWISGTLPLVLAASRETTEVYRDAVEQWIRATQQVTGVLAGALKQALFAERDRRAAAPPDPLLDFRQRAEREFFGLLPKLAKAPAAEDRAPLSRRWLARLQDLALELFDRTTSAGSFEALDPQRWAAARNRLRRNLHGPKLRNILGLPDPSPAAEAPPGSEETPA